MRNFGAMIWLAVASPKTMAAVSMTSCGETLDMGPPGRIMSDCVRKPGQARRATPVDP